jgi:hypothetical protein
MAVTEVLSDEEAYLFAILSDNSGLDLAEFAWVDHENPDDCFRAWPFQWTWWRDDSPLQIDQCVAEGQLVLTKTGWWPIEQVLVGTKVLTHQGRWRRVTAVLDQGVRPVVCVRGQGHSDGLMLTRDHQLYARRARRASAPRDGHKGKVLLEPEWLAPGAWEWNDGSGKMHANWASPALIEGRPLPSQMVPAYRSGRQNLVADCLTPEWLWVYGLFVAEGSTFFGKGGDRTARTVFSVHPREVREVEERLDKVGLRHSRTTVHNTSAINVVVNSRPVADWLQIHGGKLAHNKHLAPWVYGLDETCRQAILDGLVFGDGYTRPGPTGRVGYTTVSPALAYGVRLLANTLGYATCVRRVRPPTQGTVAGRVVNQRNSYIVELSKVDDHARRHVQFHGGVAWSPVTAVEDAGTARVYDLEVEDDHSFVVEGVVVHNCSRSVGKSLGIKARAFAFPFCHPGQEMVITAPELVHLEPIVSLVERQFYDTRLGREILPRGRSAVTHRPFQMNFLTGARIIGRIPQITGKGVKGIHPVSLELDEAQDYPADGWTELIETLKRGSQGAVWRAHGVTRGIRDRFYEFTQEGPDNRWRVHRITAIHRPNWSDEEREEKIRLYGSREAPDYRRNVLGLHGDQTNPLFVLHRLMRSVDSVEASPYNTEEYQYYSVKAEPLEEMAGPRIEDQALAVGQILDFPELHRRNGDVFWCGMDVGFTAAPSEILVFVEYTPSVAEAKADGAATRAVPEKGQTRLKLLSRINLQRIGHPLQVRVIEHVIDFYRPRAFGMDKTGNGLPLFQDIQSRSLDLAGTVKGYNFSEKVIVDIDGTVYLGERDDPLKEAAIRSNVLEYSTDKLRELVDHGRLYLPWDRDLIREFQGQTWAYSKAAMDAYGRRRRIFSAGEFHALDAARMVAMAHAQHGIETFIEERRHKEAAPVLDYFVMA